MSSIWSRSGLYDKIFCKGFFKVPICGRILELDLVLSQSGSSDRHR